MVNKQRFNNFALNAITKAPNIPDYHLMVGSAEDTASLPLLVYDKAYIPAEIAANIQTMQTLSSEDIYAAIAENALEVNDLNGNIAALGV